MELLRAVHYEATRARLDPQLVLGRDRGRKRLSQVRGVPRRRARLHAGDAVLGATLIGQPDHNLFHLRTNLAYGCAILRHYLDLESGDYFRALGRYNGSLGQARVPEPGARGMERPLEVRRAHGMSAARA